LPFDTLLGIGEEGRKKYSALPAGCSASAHQDDRSHARGRLPALRAPPTTE